MERIIVLRRFMLRVVRRYEWTDPLHLARLLLWAAVRDRAHLISGVTLDLGCGDQPYRGLLTQVSQYVGVDIHKGGKVDVSANAMCLPFRDSVFDSVLCNEVLEHVPEPALLMNEAARVLRPHGVLLLTTPQTWGLHLEPHDYYRFTKYGLRHLAETSGLEVVEISPTCGLWSTLAQRLADTVVYTYVGRTRPRTAIILSILVAPILNLGYVLDSLAGRRGDTLDNILVARKAPLATGGR